MYLTKRLFIPMILLSLIIFQSCQPSACECLEIVDNKVPYFGNNGVKHAKKSAECYSMFSDEPYQKYTATNDWKKQLKHAERLQPKARENMINICNGNTTSISNSKLLTKETISGDSLKSTEPTDYQEINGMDNKSILQLINNFYSSLELSAALNQKQYEVGGVKFDVSKFNSHIDNSSKYPKLRISNLTGDYHDRYNIKLINLDSISKDNINITVFTSVEYQIYGVGVFENKEVLIFNMKNDLLLLNKWEDRSFKKKSQSDYEGSNNSNLREFYDLMGSINK